MMDWLRLDIDLPGQEDKLRSFDRRLTDLLRTLDDRLEALEEVVSPKGGEVETGDYGGLDTDVGYTAGLGVQVKVKRHTLLYELRWRRTDIPDVWHYMVQAENEFHIGVDEPDNLEVEIRYLPDAFSQWTPWRKVEVAPTVHPAEGLGGVGEVTVTVTGNSALVVVEIPSDLSVPKSMGNFGLYVKLAKYDGETIPTEDEAPFWGTVPYPQNSFTIPNLSFNTTYYLFIRLTTYGNLGGQWVPLETVKQYEVVSFTTEYGDVKVNISPPFFDSHIVLHSMESTSGWSLSAGEIKTVTNRVEGDYALAFRRPSETTYITATYTFPSDQSNSGHPVFSCWYYVPGTEEPLKYLRFVFKDSGGSTIFTALFNYPTGMKAWHNYRLYVGESSSIRTVEIQFTWKGTTTGWVYLDFLGFYPVNYLPFITAEAEGGAVLFYPPTGLPGFLSILQPVGMEAVQWTSTTTQTVPAGQLYYVLTAHLTATGDSLILGGNQVYQTFTGSNDYQIYQVVGSGERITFQRTSGNARVIYAVFNIPEFMRWYTDQAMTNTTPFPSSDAHVGWFWDWAMTGGATAFRPTNINVNITTPSNCKRNVFNPWIHWGGFRYIANTGTIYISGLFAEKEGV